MGKREVLFSSYIAEESILTVPDAIEIQDTQNYYRYSITIPFKDRQNDHVAVVIMKNPSKAGIYDNKLKRKISDDSVYKVCDYLYKHTDTFSKVIILNLFPIYGSVFKNIEVKDNSEFLGEGSNLHRNNEVITDTLDSLKKVPHKIILAWGGYPNNSSKKIKQLYRDQILRVLNMINGKPTYKVGNHLSSRKFPPHGYSWYDFYELVKFTHTSL